MNCVDVCPKGLNPTQGDRQDQGTDGAPRRLTRHDRAARRTQALSQPEVALPARPARERPVHRALSSRATQRTLTARQAAALDALMDLADNDLLDLLLRRSEPHGRPRPARGARGAGAAAHVRATRTYRTERNRAMMNPSDIKATLSFRDGSPSIELPIYKGSIGPDVIDIRKLYAQTGMFTYDPGFLSTASCQSTHHLHRRRQGRAAVPRLPDRAAGRAVRLPRDLLPAAVRRAAEPRRSRRPSTRS